MMNALTSISDSVSGDNMELEEGGAQNDLSLDCDVSMHNSEPAESEEDLNADAMK